MTNALTVPSEPIDHAARRAELVRLLEVGGLVSHFQPIVDLDTRETVAFEALARGPVDSPLAMPGDLFGTAARNGLIAELDWACRAAALRGAAAKGLTSPATVFINVEPVAASADIPGQYADAVDAAGQELRVIFELTERALTERPAEVLRSVRQLRELGAGIALDDVGVDARSLALMPFLRPDVIKLDMSLVHGPLTPAMARTMHAVNAYAEESGAVVLAEGIEDEEHLARALALGSRYGQGWFFGRPTPDPDVASVTSLPAELAAAAAPSRGSTPYDRVRRSALPERLATKRLLLSLSRELELHAETLGPEAVVLANLQHHEHFTPATRVRYRRMAQGAAFVGLLGTGISAVPEPSVRTGDLEPGEAMVDEWSVIVISPHFAAAMVARDLGDARDDDMNRRFSYQLTYDRARVVDAARLMMARMDPPAIRAIEHQLRLL